MFGMDCYTIVVIVRNLSNYCLQSNCADVVVLCPIRLEWEERNRNE